MYARNSMRTLVAPTCVGTTRHFKAAFPFKARACPPPRHPLHCRTSARHFVPLAVAPLSLARLCLVLRLAADVLGEVIGDVDGAAERALVLLAAAALPSARAEPRPRAKLRLNARSGGAAVTAAVKVTAD